ncbi:MAG: hypothetical protein RIR70_2153 [Pseudomonadota bacterium]
MTLISDPSTFILPLAAGGKRFDQAVAELMPEHSRNRIQGWLREGRILIDGRSVDGKKKAAGGECVTVMPLALPEQSALLAEDIPLRIVFEDEAILVLDKPAALVVHPGSGNWSGTLLNALLHHCPNARELPRAGIVHRLDKDTSGLLVVAKTLTAQTALVRQLEARSVKRLYMALARGQVQSGGLVDAPIGRHPTQRIKMAVVDSGREARTHYTVRERFDKCTLLECSLETGRTHQIRVHMAHIGHPLVGDATYARGKTGVALLDAFPRQALHAWRLGLIHPESGEPMAWESPLPEDFSALLEDLRHSTP